MKDKLLWLIQPCSGFTAHGPAALWAALIFILSSIPGDKYPDVNIRQADKVVHFLLYVPIGILFSRSITAISTMSQWGIIAKLFTLTLGFAFGATDEIHQLWVRNRSCSVYDWIVDCAAVTVGLLLFTWLCSFRKT